MVSIHGLIINYASSFSTPCEDLKSKLVSSYTLSRWQRVNKLIHHPALLPEDEVPGSLFLGLFFERLPVEIRDQLVAREFKNPWERVLQVGKLWNACRANAADSLLAAAATSPCCFRDHEQTHDQDDSSPAH